MAIDAATEQKSLHLQRDGIADDQWTKLIPTMSREPFDDTVLYPTSDQVANTKLTSMRRTTRVCLPEPCDKLEAYSGFIPVDEESHSSYLFFLHILAKHKPEDKPLLLWIQGGPWKSVLFSQFLENGPLGMDADGKFFYREHSLIKFFNVLYLDAPVGSGYSFDENETYPTTIEEVTDHIARFIKRFLRVFPEYRYRDFYIAGESYAARPAVGIAHEILKKPRQFQLKLKGVMLGVPFLFSLLDLIDSSDYLYQSRLLDDSSRITFASWFQIIESRVGRKEYLIALDTLDKLVLNVPPTGVKTIYQLLTGFQNHGSIAKSQQQPEVGKYSTYANSTNFKRIIHVGSTRTLNAQRSKLEINLAKGDLFVEITTKFKYILENTDVLFYTAQLDAVFPEANIERCFKTLRWRGSESFKTAERKLWYKDDERSSTLFGYERIIGTLLYSTVILGGHDISLDRSDAVNDLYRRFLHLQKTKQLKWK
ncbi:venom serine carboxypeptidase-like [Dermacentor variabilis]|uniref:venom serine carboxypeptidase-like n=1 Tax=Dermacentor variabilis TaxID=34621 RepID=UPI003F5B68C8